MCKDDVFIYDDNDTFKGNFSAWYSMNSTERENWKLRAYPRDRAYRVFCRIHGEKQNTKPKQLCMF
jgi:hypothetical protein